MRVWMVSNHLSLFWEMRHASAQQNCDAWANTTAQTVSQFSKVCVGMRVCANDHRRGRWYALTVFWQNSSAMSKHIELQMRGSLCSPQGRSSLFVLASAIGCSGLSSCALISRLSSCYGSSFFQSCLCFSHPSQASSWFTKFSPTGPSFASASGPIAGGPAVFPPSLVRYDTCFYILHEKVLGSVWETHIPHPVDLHELTHTHTSQHWLQPKEEEVWPAQLTRSNIHTHTHIYVLGTQM